MRVLRQLAFFLVACALIAYGLGAFLTGSPVYSQADVQSAILGRLPKIGSYPAGATQLRISSGNVAAATATATLPAAAGVFTEILGFDITGGGATAASVIVCTVTDGTWTLSYDLAIPAGVTAALTPFTMRFPEPLAGSAVNTTIAVSCPTFGAGNTNAAVSAYGFQTATTP